MEWGVGADVDHIKRPTVESSTGIELKMKNDDAASILRRNDSMSSVISHSSSIALHFPSLWKFFVGFDARTKVEIAICCVLVATVFAMSAYEFSLSKIESLVPFSSISDCDTSQEMFTLAQQDVNINYDAVVKFVDYRVATTSFADAMAAFNGSWTSCGGNTFNRSSFGMKTSHNTTLLPILFNLTYVNYSTLVDDPVSVSGIYGEPISFSAAVTSTDGCFSLTCGFSYTYVLDHHGIAYYLDKRLLFIIPVTANDVYDDKGNFAGNAQLMASISTTSSSVSATCAVDIVGVVYFILTEANTISSSGTYLCTKYSSTFQVISSALSLSLTAIGICRAYFAVKAFYQTK
jgi:hypothetical protein